VNEIIFALGELDANPEVDVIIVARGGGSFQDLLPFSDERLVRFAATLSKPLVSAIGHENDQPLLDLVADLRASTPTDAAKRVVPDVVEERRNIGVALGRLTMRIQSFLETQMQLLDSIRSRPVMASPYGFVENQSEQISMFRKRVNEIFDFRLLQSSSEISQLHARARSLSPKLTLERGYAVIADANGKALTKITKGQEIVIKTAKQEISATATEVKETK
jgi:exodeoxyribonuclease VII large subunit